MKGINTLRGQLKDKRISKYDFTSQEGKAVLTSDLKPRLHGAIYRPDSFVLMLRYCANLKAIRYESTSFNEIVTDKVHRVIVAQAWFS